MYLFWRLTIAFFATVISLVLFTVFIRSSVFTVNVFPNLPDLDIHKIPPADTIIPRLVQSAATATTLTSAPTTLTPTSAPTTLTPTSAPTTLTPTSTVASATTPSKSRGNKKLNPTSNNNELGDNLLATSAPSPYNSSSISPEQCLNFAKSSGNPLTVIFMAGMERNAMKAGSIALILALLWSEALGGSISIYWGQNRNEPSLAETCATGNFAIVILGFLTTFGYGRTPVLDLAGHCNPSSGGCQSLSADIISCQSKGIKVFLSLGGESGNCAIGSSQGAQNVASYLWNNFLGGKSTSRPLGSAVLDGIDFHIQYTTSEHWDDLARSLSAFSSSSKKIYLSAAPYCLPPLLADLANSQQPAEENALQTGLFDYVWIKFYNYPSCQYSDGDASKLLSSWKQWITTVTTTTQKQSFFVGLPASPNATFLGGFIPASILISDVLPEVKECPEYGGVMLWNEFYDDQTHYSSYIKKCV